MGEEEALGPIDTCSRGDNMPAGPEECLGTQMSALMTHGSFPPF
jgi:hypothetical protein